MPKQPTRGKTQVNLEITTELLDRYRAFAVGRSEKLAHAVERAMLRDMTYPPPEPEVAPLPDAPAKKKPRK